LTLYLGARGTVFTFSNQLSEWNGSDSLGTVTSDGPSVLSPDERMTLRIGGMITGKGKRKSVERNYEGEPVNMSQMDI
jgi:hypothetical protein